MRGDHSKIDSSNWFFVASAAGDRLIINGTVPPVLTEPQALNLAAWLVAIADPSGDRFAEVLAAIKRT